MYVEFSTNGGKMENYFEILKKCRMFTGLDIDDIKCLTEILNSKVVKYSKGDVIFSEGENLSI